jgi:hypothetical protein
VGRIWPQESPASAAGVQVIWSQISVLRFTGNLIGGVL